MWVNHQLPVRSYVLLLTRRGVPENLLDSKTIEAGDLQITANYHIVRLNKIPAADVLKLNRENLLPFLPLMDGKEEELEMGAERLGKIKDEWRQRELSLHFLLLGGLRYNPTELLELIGRKSMIPLEQLKESSFYQFIVKEGLEEGLEKGQLKAAADTLRLLIAKRFPEVDLNKEIDRISDVSLLQQLSVDVLDTPSSEAMKERLAAALEVEEHHDDGNER
jgi:predicted transposase YdaD